LIFVSVIGWLACKVREIEKDQKQEAISKRDEG
jgi:hypothetical protein